MQNVKDRIKELIYTVERDGITFLYYHMKECGFFEAPCSGANHLAIEGGLAEHSLNVYNTLCKLNESLEAGLNEESMILVALLHDLGKMGDHGKPNYVQNYIRSKTKNKETGEYDMVRSDAKPYITNPALTYEEHEIRSLLIAERFIFLTEEEETAILHHNGLYSKLDSSFGNANHCKTKLAYLLHVADMYCSRFVEVNDGVEI